MALATGISRIFLVSLAILPAAAVSQETAADARDADPAAACQQLFDRASYEAALEPCRTALTRDPESPSLMNLLAQVEFAEGNSLRSAELWQRLIDRDGWKPELARGRAKALWRGAQPREAEGVFRDVVSRAGTAESYGDLVEFLLTFDRNDEAAEVAKLAAKRFPADCSLLESWGVAEAGRGRHGRARKMFAKAVRAGCPPYRWTRRGVVPGQLARPEYRPLLVPAELLAGIELLDRYEVLHRLDLLRLVLAPQVAGPLADLILARKENDIRLTSFALIGLLPAEVPDCLRKLLGSDDFIVRKLALRLMVDLRRPYLVPLLEEHVGHEEMPGNQALTSLALGRILLQGKDPGRGKALLTSIPEDDSVYSLALTDLAGYAEAHGSGAEAETLRAKARASAPRSSIPPPKDLGEKTPAAPPETPPSPEPKP